MLRQKCVNHLNLIICVKNEPVIDNLRVREQFPVLEKSFLGKLYRGRHLILIASPLTFRLAINCCTVQHNAGLIDLLPKLRRNTFP